MESLFNPNTPVNEIYDLKGSTVNRHVEVSRANPSLGTHLYRDESVLH